VSARRQPLPASSVEAGPASATDVLELRQYTLLPGRFAALVALFEREFIETQEAAGMSVIGQFRDLDDADRFVWLRGFGDRPTRRRGLEAFYGGAHWQRLRGEANAHFVDTDDVLLLRPVSAEDRLSLDEAVRPAADETVASGLVVVAVYPVETDDAAEVKRWFARDLRPALAEAGIAVRGWYESDPRPNDFPRLPVREGETVLVWIATFDDRKSADAALHALGSTRMWRDTLGPGLRRRLSGTPQLLRLEPTPRSLLRGGT
jgi:hypothetical protein